MANGFNRPGFRDFYFDEETIYQVDIIDTWEMTNKSCGVFKGKFRVELPGKEYMAVRIKQVQSLSRVPAAVSKYETTLN